MKYVFIEQHKAEFTLASLCRVLGVSRSGFYAWKSREPSARDIANEELVKQIRRVHQEHRGACGAFTAWRVLREEGIDCGKHRVARLRKAEGIEAKRKQRFRVTKEHRQTVTAPRPAES